MDKMKKRRSRLKFTGINPWYDGCLGENLKTLSWITKGTQRRVVLIRNFLNSETVKIGHVEVALKSFSQCLSANS